MAKHQITWSNFSLDNKFRRHNDPKIPTVTFLVTGKRCESWRNAAEEVHALFRGHNLARVQLEFLDPNGAHFIKLLGMPSGHPLIAQYERISAQVVERVHYYLGTSWVNIGLYDCQPGPGGGLFAERATAPAPAIVKPTIVVTVKEGSLGEWEKVAAVVKEVALAGGSTSLAVEILPGELMLATSLRVLEALPKNGASIGIKGSESAGTLGGFVELHLPGVAAPRLCGMTCYHVVESFDPSIAAKTREQGIPLRNAQDEARTTMEYPSALDLRDTVAAIRREEEMRRAMLDSAQAKINEGMATRANQNAVVRSPGLIASCARELATCQQLQQTPIRGQVLVASGSRETTRGSRLDWALFDIPPQAFGQNHPPSHEDTLPRLEDYDMESTDVIADFRSLKFGQRVIKRGRSTNITHGVVKPTMSKSQWPDGTSTWEFEVIAARINGNGEEEKYPFCEKGDSGAWVTDTEGRLVGLLFGLLHGGDTYAIGSGLVMPISDVINDIEAVTGGRIRLP